jgi:CBS domain-containing protein
MLIRDVMSINATRIRAGSSLRQAADIVGMSSASDIAVVDDDNNFLGVLSEGDMMRATLPQLTEVLEAGGHLDDSYSLFEEKGHSIADQPIETIMIRRPLVLTPNDNLHRAATLMASRDIRRLPVVEGGKLVGTVSRADVCRAVFT